MIVFSYQAQDTIRESLFRPGQVPSLQAPFPSVPPLINQYHLRLSTAVTQLNHPRGCLYTV